MTSTTSTAAVDFGTAITQHEIVIPSEFDEATARTIDAALSNAMDLNRHRSALLRSAVDPSMAATLFLALTGYVVEAVEDGWPAQLSRWMSEQHGLACWVRRYAARRLATPDDDLALHAVQTRIARLVCAFPAPVTEGELTLLHHDPVSLVRAAYAVAREFRP
ncbi:hypothetical protein M6B22_13385 [Jatrophihabitans cynanchi]|uniref:Uncharacterized protein n=1 Tax=Jatrophihabitans cynanchi TaxID=2944128 RepID=A0ABY7JT74_9ACTN|nr:hypothetical protein [Jatrophihabitans sp. SB3-54]WAX55533.1 hypothetical protein M6B22_13385 [Jatrophihabitans sp. SB3-54]